MKLKLFLALTLSALSLPAAVIFQDDFEAGLSFPPWSGSATVQTTGGLSAFGFGANHLRYTNALTSGLQLFNLLPHNSITLSFDLAIWDAVNSAGSRIVVLVDGSSVLDTIFGNYSSASGPGTLLTPAFTGTNSPDYGFGIERDSARRVSLSFAHSASSLVILWQYPNSVGPTLSGSFGIDNVRLETDAVPEPSTLALAGIALAALAARKYRLAR
jgi:hypothetical protein